LSLRSQKDLDVRLPLEFDELGEAAITRAVDPSAREGPRRRLDRSSRTPRASLLASSAAAWPSSIDSLKTADHGG
jgi:hypothetical protein